MKLPKIRIKKIVTMSIILSTAALISALPSRAAQLSSASVTLSDSRPGQTSVSYAYAFTTATTGTIAKITFQYCTTSSGTCTLPTNLSAGTTASGVSGIGAGTSAFSTDTVTYTVTSPASVGASTAIALTYSNTNPDAGNYYVRIKTQNGSNATIDSATVAFTTTAEVTVTATIDSSLSFAVTGFSSGVQATLKGSEQTDAGCTTSAIAVTFPNTITPGSGYLCGQTLTTSTNASGGYVVKLKSTRSGGATPFFKDPATNNTIADHTGTDSSPASFSSGLTSGEGFGYTTSDTSLGTGTANRFNGDKYAGVPTSATEVAYSSTPISNDAINIGYKLQAAATTKAGQYSGTLIYIVTATF